ncbi:histone deacetylase domain-containing protein [Lentinula edodes]|uniref:Histone deacetylase domain-containing protein n=1 Tax=Lentinula lateritia TaxID=40482 RepID=A0A9W9AV83_9AGAR|nr:histone deacetylase domain-containing protein [Lentinula edodes]
MANASIFIQDACYQHRYIRSRDTSLIVERPERLIAAKIGLAAAVTRIQEVVGKSAGDPNDLVAALDKLTLGPRSSDITAPINVVHSSATLDILNHPAVKFTHGFPDPNTAKDSNEYLRSLKKWSEDSIEKISKGDSEIPQGLAQGDLYLCPESLNAIQGALGTVCECIDTVVDPNPSSSKRAFVAIRPPGHHCGEDTPSGFCFVNNVIVGAAHAHLKHGIHRVVIFDIDLHHGNGTQSLAWAINEETQRQKLEAEARTEAGNSPPATIPGLQIYYSSIHDILSYPCEDGTPSMVQAASVSISGAHGQWVENVHLKDHEEGDFWGLYEQHYKKIIHTAEEFVHSTATKSNEDVLVFISCGFDASEHEYASMSRHGRKVPTNFYAQFTKDARAFAEKHAKGRIVSVLEGGYSDRALISGTFAHFCALGLSEEHTWNDRWWNKDNLDALQHALKPKKPRSHVSGPLSAPKTDPESEPWLKQAVSIFQHLEPVPFKTPRKGKAILVEPSSRTLRQRKVGNASSSSPASAKSKPEKSEATGKGMPRGKINSSFSKGKGKKTEPGAVAESARSDGQAENSDSSTESSSTLSSMSDSDADLPPISAPSKKLPRVILKLGPPPDS